MVPLQLVVASALAWTGESSGKVLEFTMERTCRPCQTMSPIVSRLQRQGLPIEKVDFDHDKKTTAAYGVDRFPTFILVIDGREVERKTGLMSEEGLKAMCSRIPSQANERTPQQRSAANSPASVDLGQDAALPTTSPKSAAAKAEAPKKDPGEPSALARFFGAKKKEAPAAPSEVRAQGDDPLPAASERQSATPLAATVRLRVKDNAGDNVGTGTIIDSRPGQTLVLTCGHIFRQWAKGSRVYVDIFNGEQVTSFVGKLVDYELDDRKGLDIGLVSFAHDQALPACRVAASDAGILAGAPVASVGCGGGEPPTVQPQKITKVNRYKTNDIECSAIPEQGRSGGGLFNGDRRVIGICMCADPKYREGLYAGLKAIHKFLDRQRLSHIYRDESPTSEEPQFAAQTETSDDESAAEEVAQATEPVRERPRRKAKEVTAMAEADTSREQLENPAVSQEDVVGSEVVIIIRGNGKPGSSSKVVRLHRATRGFWEDLVSEIDPRESLQETTLKRTPRETAPRTERRQARRPATTNEAAANDISPAIAEAASDEPERYRRQRSARRNNSARATR